MLAPLYHRCAVFRVCTRGGGLWEATEPYNHFQCQRKPRAAAARSFKMNKAGWPRGLLRGAMRGRRAARPVAQTHAHCPGHQPSDGRCEQGGALREAMWVAAAAAPTVLKNGCTGQSRRAPAAGEAAPVIPELLLRNHYFEFTDHYLLSIYGPAPPVPGQNGHMRPKKTAGTCAKTKNPNGPPQCCPSLFGSTRNGPGGV